jgi:hypothetical protein
MDENPNEEQSRALLKGIGEMFLRIYMPTLYVQKAKEEPIEVFLKRIADATALANASGSREVPAHASNDGETDKARNEKSPCAAPVEKADPEVSTSGEGTEH